MHRRHELNGLRCLEAANALIRVHKPSTQNQNLRSKTSRISMSQRDNCKSCHSDQLSSHEKSSWGTMWGTKRPREHLLCFFKHAANSLKPRHAAYAGDVRFRENSGHGGMSALPPKADIGLVRRDVRFVPKADILPLLVASDSPIKAAKSASQPSHNGS